jgi:cytochrome P450
MLRRLVAAQEAAETSRTVGAPSGLARTAERPTEPAAAALPTVLGVLRDCDGEGGPSEAEETRRQTAGLLFAGLNSAKELHALLHLLARYPDIQQAARSEVDEQLSGFDDSDARGRPLEYHDLSGEAPTLQYCARVVYEALRLSPGIEHLRLLTTRTTRVPAPAVAAGKRGGCAGAGAGAGHVLLPSGTRLVISPAHLHRSPLLWPQPCDVPRPEFFSKAARAAREAGAFLPFSFGAKGCPAASFALHEMRMVLALVVQRFELVTLPGSGERGGGATVGLARRDVNRRTAARSIPVTPCESEGNHQQR